jgi:predicted lactoylglutathione lyase
MDASTTDSIENMVNQVAIYDKNDKLIRKVKNDEFIKLYGLMQEYIKQADGEDSGNKAQKLLNDNGVQQKITINNLGNVANVTGGTVVVRESYTGLYGLFYIDSDTHTWKNGLYLNKLVINFKNIMDEKEVGELPNKTGSKTKSTSGGSWSYTNKPGGD